MSRSASFKWSFIFEYNPIYLLSPTDLDKVLQSFYAEVRKPVSNSLWYKNVPMVQHTINSIMKRMIENSPLRNSDKKLTNHSARKTLVKKLR